MNRKLSSLGSQGW